MCWCIYGVFLFLQIYLLQFLFPFICNQLGSVLYYITLSSAGAFCFPFLFLLVELFYDV